MNTENLYYRSHVLRNLGRLGTNILIIYLCLGSFSWGDDHLRESSANLDDIFVSSTDSSSKSLNDSDIQIFYLVSDPCWGNLEKDKNNLLESELRKIYPESGSLSWLEFPISPDLPSNPYGIKTWRICRQQLLYRHYYPFTHFWYEYLNLMPCWMYSLTDYINAPELQAIQLLPCLLKQLSDTMSLFQHSPRRLGMEWVDIGALNMQEYGGTLSMIQYQNMPWVALCSYFTGRTDLKDKSWLVWCSEYISRVVRKYQYLYRLIYNTSEFAHLGVYEQLWISHQFKENNELKNKDNHNYLADQFDSKRLWNILFPKDYPDSIRILFLDFQYTAGLSIRGKYIYYAMIKNDKMHLFNDLFFHKTLPVPAGYEQLEHQYGLRKLSQQEYWEMALSLDGVTRGLIISNDLFPKMKTLFSQLRFQRKEEISDSELFYIRMPNDLEWKKSSSIVNDENLTKFQDMIMDIALILHSEFLHQFVYPVISDEKPEVQ